MEKYLVDTTVLVDHLRGKTKASKFLERDDYLVSAITLAELLQGARNKKEQKIIEELISQLAVSWGNKTINQLAIELIQVYFLKHNLRFLDALIAATALQGNLILVTANTKHFQFISGLKLINF